MDDQRQAAAHAKRANRNGDKGAALEYDAEDEDALDTSGPAADRKQDTPF